MLAEVFQRPIATVQAPFPLKAREPQGPCFKCSWDGGSLGLVLPKPSHLIHVQDAIMLTALMSLTVPGHQAQIAL